MQRRWWQHGAVVAAALAVLGCGGQDALVVGADAAGPDAAGLEVRTDSAGGATDASGPDQPDATPRPDALQDSLVQTDAAAPTDAAAESDVPAVTDAQVQTDISEPADAEGLTDVAAGSDSAAMTDAQAQSDVPSATDTQAQADTEPEPDAATTDAGIADAATVDTGPADTDNADAVDPEDGQVPDDTTTADAADTAETGDAADVDSGPTVPPCAVGIDPKKVCLRWGVCEAGVPLACDAANQPYCDYAAVPGWELFEASCDGLDNDCNKVVDDIPLGGPLATNQLGVCYGSRLVCTKESFSGPALADLPGYEAQEASCDGLDNDCDGLIDFMVVAPPLWDKPGVCGKAFLVCDGSNGWQTPPPFSIVGYQAQESACDGQDNDCDGLTDEGLYVFGGGVAKQGVCTGAPLVCAGGLWVAPWNHPDWPELPGLASLPALPTTTWQEVETACDGLDNDCDGLTDSDIVNPPAADLNQGVCEGLTKVCLGASGGWQEPEYGLVLGYSAATELSCDGLDNNCNGKTDEAAACAVWQRGGRGTGSVSLSPDGERLAFTSMTGVHVTQVADGKRVLDHFGHGWEVSSVDFSPDGSRLASAGRYDALRVYGSVQTAAQPQPSPVYVAIQNLGMNGLVARWSPDGARLLVGESAGPVRLFGAVTGVQLGAFSMSNAVRGAAFVQQGSDAMLAMWLGDGDGEILRWHAVTKQVQLVDAVPGAVLGIETAADSTHALVLWEGGPPRVYDTETGRLLAVLGGHTGTVVACALPGAASAVTVESTGLVRRFALPAVPPPSVPANPTILQAAALLGSAPVPAGDSAGGVAVHGDRIVVGFVASGPWQRLGSGPWTPVEGQATEGLTALAASQGVLASSHGDGTVRLRDGLTGSQLTTAPGHEGGTTALALWGLPGPAALGTLGNGALLATGGLDFAMRLWTVQPSGNGFSVLNQKTFGLGGPWAEDLAPTPDGTSVWATAGNTAQRFSWLTESAGTKLQAYAVPFGSSVQTVRVSPDGKRILLGLGGGSALGGVVWRMLDAATLAVLWERADLPANRHVAAFHPTADDVVLSGGPQRLQRVNASTGETLELLLGHAAEVAALDWQLGDRLVSVAADGTARVWSTKAGEPALSLAVMSRHCPAPCSQVPMVGAAVVDPTTRMAVTAGADGSLIGWIMP